MMFAMLFQEEKKIQDCTAVSIKTVSPISYVSQYPEKWTLIVS